MGLKKNCQKIVRKSKEPPKNCKGTTSNSKGLSRIFQSKTATSLSVNLNVNVIQNQLFCNLVLNCVPYFTYTHSYSGVAAPVKKLYKQLQTHIFQRTFPWDPLSIALSSLESAKKSQYPDGRGRERTLARQDFLPLVFSCLAQSAAAQEGTFVA